jgi:diguanylate cyclase (GGDEF)-like protein
MDKNAAIAEKLRALRAAYIARLPQELESLTALTLQLSCPDSLLLAATELHQRLHKLAGSAGSFGLSALGAEAKKLELSAALLMNCANIDEHVLTQFTAQVEGLSNFAQVSLEASPPNISSNAAVNEEISIYVLEDDLDLAEEICITLRHFGHSVIHFATLAEAEITIRQKRPDFMICDVMFSEEAREAPEAIMALQAHFDIPIPVIFMSTRAGAVGYFVKPLDIIRLVDCFEYYLDRNRHAPYHVLIIDDDEALAQHYKLVLTAAEIRVDVMSDPAKVFTFLQDTCPELILMDLNMPGCSGTELAQAIRLNQDWLKIPITYLSSEQDEEIRIKAMGRAGDDFLTKPLSDRELVSAVSVRAVRSRQLSDALDRDSLTGLLKHSRIKEQVDMELSRVVRAGTSLSVVMIDLDNFKNINDTYGHAAGDRVIKGLAHLLRQRLRKTDAIGRYGGEEFVAVLPGCGQGEALSLMEDVRSHFGGLVFTANELSFSLTLSAGIACHAIGGAISSEMLLQEADAALYRAKFEGRNRVCLAPAI